MRLLPTTRALVGRPAGGRKYFRRGGVRFDERGTLVALDKLAPGAAEQIVAEPLLRVEQLDHVPDHFAAAELHLTPAELARENSVLLGRVAELESALHALTAGATPGADYVALTVTQLAGLAEARGLRVSSRRKADLVEALQDRDATAPSRLELEQRVGELEGEIARLEGEIARHTAAVAAVVEDAEPPGATPDEGPI